MTGYGLSCGGDGPWGCSPDLFMNRSYDSGVPGDSGGV